MFEITDIEKANLTRFWDNEPMREAVRKVLLHDLSSPDTLKDFMARYGNLSPEQIGQAFAAKWQGMCLVEQTFNLLSRYQTVQEIKGRINQAR